MDEGRYVQLARQRNGLVAAVIVDQNNVIHNLVRKMAIGIKQGLPGIIGGHYDDNPLSV
jgi:hypothetical protein